MTRPGHDVLQRKEILLTGSANAKIRTTFPILASVPYWLLARPVNH
jgi:hypothetical protein